MSVIWITGLAGSGKTTLAEAVASRLRRTGRAVLVLDGDAVRRVLGVVGTDYSAEGRVEVARCIASLAKLASAQGLITVVATISLFHAVHESNRESADYFEVLLHGVALRRSLRQAEHCGPQVGIDIRAEFPLQPHLILTNHADGKAAVTALAAQLIAAWERRNV